MTYDPFRHYLRIPESSSPPALLGLGDVNVAPCEVYEAYCKRLIELHRHSDGAAKEADIVRRRLHSAAKLIISARRYRQKSQSPDAESVAMDVFRKFFRVPEFAHPLELLGLSIANCRDEAIDVALVEQLVRIDAHPEKNSSVAEEMRETLRVAADMLKDDSIRQVLIAMRRLQTRPGVPLTSSSSRSGQPAAAQHSTPTSRPEAPASPAVAAPPRSQRRIDSTALLTPFDRQVLAVLIGCGGWNGTSRSLLVSLAETYQVSPDGLVKVIKGLSDYARSHRARLGIKEITEGMTPGATNGQQTAGRKGDVPAQAVEPHPSAPPQRATGEEMPLFWNPVTLSLLAAFITISVGLTIMAIVIPKVLFDAPKAADTVVQNDDAATSDDPGTTNAPNRADPDEHRQLANFITPPSFLGNGLPIAGADAADASLSLPEDFDAIERKLSITDTPSEAVFRDWVFFIDQFTTGWVLLDESTRRDATQSMLETLAMAADNPNVSDRFLQALTPLRGQVPDPIDLWRDSWKTYLLGRIINTRSMAPVVIEQARRQLDLTLRPLPPESRRLPADLARAWLAQASTSLIESLEYESRAYDFWELWLSAQREFGVVEARDMALMHVVERIMRTGVDLARPGPSVNVVGRLLDLIDWQGGDTAGQWLSTLFGDSEISTRDLWVFTSLLARHERLAWFTDELVLPDGAEDRYRARLRDRILQAWPSSSSDPARQDDALGAHARFDSITVQPWVELISQLHEQPVPFDDVGRMQFLLAASYTNESIMFLLGQQREAAIEAYDEATQTLHALTRDAADDQVGQSNTQRQRAKSNAKPGQPIGPDGIWSARYEDARRDTNLRLDLLSELASTAGTDLGFIDAEVFVREVYRGVPEDIRSQARSVLLHRFSHGPNVAMELLDQMTNAGRGQRLSDFISGLTGQVLSSVGSDSWKLDARMALIEHALILHRSGRSEVDLLTQDLIDSYVRRTQSTGGEQRSASRPEMPYEAAQLLVEARRSVANQLIASAPVPDDLPGLHGRRVARLRLAEGPIQRFVAEQVAVMELLAYITVADHPSLTSPVLDLLARSAERRARAAHVLVQAAEIELTMSDLYRLQLEVASARRAGGAGS